MEKGLNSHKLHPGEQIMITELTSALKWDPVFCFYISSLRFPESAGILHPFSQKNQWYVSRERLAVKATAWTNDPVTEHTSHFRMFVNDMLTCSWALRHVLGLCVAGLFPLTPAGSFQTGEQMLLIVFTMTLTDQHVTKGEAGVFDVWKIKGRIKVFCIQIQRT